MSLASTSIRRYISTVFVLVFFISTKEVCILKVVKNKDGKTICAIDPKRKVVVIVKKGMETTITFHDDGTYEINDKKTSA